MPTINLIASAVAINHRICKLQFSIKKIMIEEDLIEILEAAYPDANVTPAEKEELRAKTKFDLLHETNELHYAKVDLRIIQALIPQRGLSDENTRRFLDSRLASMPSFVYDRQKHYPLSENRSESPYGQ
jgi:hypothetical protein